MIVSISIQTDDDGNPCVHLVVSGLESVEQAENAVVFLQNTLCGKEITIN